MKSPYFAEQGGGFMSEETFTHERASFRERIAKLAGGTTYREPIGGRSTDPNRMTDQDVAAALAYARQGPDDIGPDVAYCIACQSDWHRPRIVRKLADALNESGGQWARKARGHLLSIADGAFLAVAMNRPPRRPANCHEGAYERLMLVGLSTLETLAGESVRRAEYAFRNAG